MHFPQTDALWQRAKRVLAGGPATLSKHPTRFPHGLAPTFLERGDGAYVWDIDGNRYLDTISALGPIILGHNHPAVTEAVWTQAERLTSASLPTRLEVEVAERLCGLIPGAEQARLASNGKDVTEAAVKVARHITGKRHAIYIGYHGGFGDYLATTDKNGGVLAVLSPYNHQLTWGAWDDLAILLQQCRNDVACIMFEVPPEPWGLAEETTHDTMQYYCDAAHEQGGLAIIDEVVTGFRYGLGGAQQLYGVQADLATFSKGMANGYKLSALIGPRALMQAFDGGKVFLSTTFGGEATALAACLATLDVLEHTPALRRLQEQGQAIGDRLAQAIVDLGSPCKLRGNYARMVLDWQPVHEIATADELRTLWLQELLRHGVLASVPLFPMCCYDTTITEALRSATEEALLRINEVVDGRVSIGQALECEVITDVFQQRHSSTFH